MENELSPLDQIRKAEAEIARQIAAAQKKTEQKLAQARRDAQELRQSAREKGRQLGQVHGKEILAKSEEEAKAILDLASKQAEIHFVRGHEQMEAAVLYAVAFILGSEGENEEK